MNSRFRTGNKNVSLDTRGYEVNGVLGHHGECREMQEEFEDRSRHCLHSTDGGSASFSFPLHWRGRGEKKSLGNGGLEGRAMEPRANLRIDGLDIMAAAKGSTMCMSTSPGLHWNPPLKRS